MSETPLYSWRGHLVEVEIWEGPAEILVDHGTEEIHEGETVAHVHLLDVRRSWTVPYEDLEEHAEPVNLAALEEAGMRHEVSES